MGLDARFMVVECLNHRFLVNGEKSERNDTNVHLVIEFPYAQMAMGISDGSNEVYLIAVSLKG